MIGFLSLGDFLTYMHKYRLEDADVPSACAAALLFQVVVEHKMKDKLKDGY